MEFNHVLGLKERISENVKSRTAIRAVIKKDNKALLVRCNKGDYKFLGGGLKKEESHEEVLKLNKEDMNQWICREILVLKELR